MSAGRHLESGKDVRERRLPGSEEALMAGFELRAARIVSCLQAIRLCQAHQDCRSLP